MIPFHRLIIPAATFTFALALLTGCTTYTYPDGSRETVVGTPAQDETLTPEERQAQPIRYREPGVVPE